MEPRVNRLFHILLLFTVAAVPLVMGGCGAPKQKIPVSTNPIGATVFADGRKVCTTPCSVNLTTDAPHLLTIVKDGYEQEDLEITRRFKPDRAIRDGVIAGVLKGGDPKEVGKEVAKEVDEQERSGEAYELIPKIVTIRLTPTLD